MRLAGIRKRVYQKPWTQPDVKIFSSWSNTWQKAMEECQCSIYIMVKLILIWHIVVPGPIEEYDSDMMADMTMGPDKQEPPRCKL